MGPGSFNSYNSSTTGRPSDVIEGLLSDIDVASFQLTERGTIATVNRQFCSMVGETASELVGNPFTSLVKNGDFTDRRTIDELVSEFRESVTTTVRLETVDGVFPCTLSLRRVDSTSEGGRPAVLGAITERQGKAGSPSQIELASGETFAALAEALPDGIIVLDSDSVLQYANPAVERILGYTPEELVGASKVEIIPERLRENHLTALSRYLETGEKHINWTYVELPGQHKDDYEIPLGISLNDFMYDGDRYFVGLFRDVSDRKRAERELSAKAVQQETVALLGQRALESSELDQLFEKTVDLVTAALDTSHCEVLELDTDNDTLVLRDGAGWDDGLVGTETLSPLPADSQAGYTLDTARPIIVEDLEEEDRFDDNPLLSDHDIRSGITVVIGPSDDPWGVFGVHDTAPRRFTHHVINFVQSVATILASAIERAEYEYRLNETVEELAASNERLEQFASVASHDLQEPLRMVSSYLTLLESRYENELDEEALEFIEFAVDGAERMQGMIDGLLEYSRVETRGDPFEAVDLDEVIDRIRTNLTVQIEETDAEMVVEPLPTVVGDEKQLEALFQNLLSNAMTYQDEQPVRIEITASERSTAWRISIDDNGIGISDEHVDQVFDIFERLHSHAEFSGTGIGLSLCQKIADRHGGDIRVESVSGTGSTFSVTIPKRDD
ncbi:PAS domain S-box protein [Halostagnicola sp. A-GB9-2]|uniref:PAS domain-containing sensor histidine kinase n=1 Tax=Halostagnicola sp. A-GB9-2 TaxID=3048066 RepID=UPI0024BF926E|nr:PAS domain S-box protein [Halostagnicola sp. A-GB9-2]MDJ1431916.1 PAS domain S-box protein [Halostagnicola sp. A-GB9-2]